MPAGHCTAAAVAAVIAGGCTAATAAVTRRASAAGEGGSSATAAAAGSWGGPWRQPAGGTGRGRPPGLQAAACLACAAQAVVPSVGACPWGEPAAAASAGEYQLLAALEVPLLPILRAEKKAAVAAAVSAQVGPLVAAGAASALHFRPAST